jgi:hypothetical protein
MNFVKQADRQGSNFVSSDATEQHKVIDFIHISTAIANEGNMSKSRTDTFSAIKMD